MPSLTRTHHTPSAPPATNATSTSSAATSTSTSASAKSKKSLMPAVFSRLTFGRSSKKKERNDHAEPSPPAPAAPAPALRRLPHIDTRKRGFAVPGAPTGAEQLSGEPVLRRALSESQTTERRTVRFTDYQVPPDTPDMSPRTSIHGSPPRFDVSPDATPPHGTGHTEDEIVEEPETESDDDDTRSATSSMRSGDTSPERAGSSVGSDTESLPTERNDRADLLRNAHEERNPNWLHHASTDTVLLGIRTTTRPGRPMTLPQGGPALKEAPPVTPADPESVAAPPSAHPETGLRKGKKLKAVKAFVGLFVPPALRRSTPDDTPRGRTGVEAFVPALTTELDFNTRIQSLFTEAGEHANAAELAQRLHSELATPVANAPVDPDAPVDPNSPELRLTHPMLVAERLAQVTGGDGERALAAFDALRAGRFLPFSSVDLGDGSRPVRLDSLMTLEPGRPSLAQPQKDALSTAAKLASSPVGFDALLRMLQPALPEDRQPHLKRFLDALAKVEAERGAPADIAVHASAARGARDTNQATLAQDVLNIESRALEHVGNDPHASLDASEKAAIFAWDNGFRERGPGTELAKVQGRLAKMGKYVKRANHLQELRNVRFDRSDMLRSAGKVVDAKARIIAMRAQQTIGRKKSPLTGLRAFGANNNFLQHPDDDAPVLDKNAQTAIKTLRARYAEIVADPETFAPKVQDPRSKALPEPVLREALLEHWEQLFEQKQMRPLGNKLDRTALKTIAQTIATRYGADTEQTRTQIEGHLQRWAGSKLKRTGWKFDRVVSRELTLADLQKWADDIHMPMTQRTPLGQEIANGSPAQEARGRAAAAAASASPTYLEETGFATALRKALVIVDPSAIRADDLTPDGLHRFTRTYLLEHPWGNPLVASNGGTAGINTGSISESIRAVTEKFSPVSAVPILDLKISRSANAVLSIGSTTHGGEIFIGTQRQKAASAGFGLSASAGPGALAKVLAQGTGSVEITPLAIENVKTRGVMVRALRPPKEDRSGHDTAAARNELVAFNDLIWSVAKGEHGELSPEQTWELIANRFFESPTLSIGWQDQEAQTVHHPVNASVGLRIGHSIGKWIAGAFSKSETERVGGTIGYANDLTTHGSNHRKEQSGKHRLVRANYLWRFQQNATLGAAWTNPPIPLSHAAGPVTASMASGPTQMTGTFALDDRGFNTTFRAIVKSGKLSEPYTLREFEERNAKDFVKFLNEPEREAQFTQVFKAAYGLDEGEQAFENFKKKTRNWAGPGQHYVTRYRIHTEDRKILDELAALAHSIHERNPEDPMLSKIELAMKARLEDEDSWVPSQIFTLEGQTARDAFGVNFGVQFSAQETVASDRELSATAVPLPIANEWTRVRRDGRAGNTSVHPGTEEHTAGA